jgi:hypothetical protein
VETSDAGKAVAGATILAGICMEMEKTGPTQRISPKLPFVFYKEDKYKGILAQRWIIR